ncbi:MAG TPA: lipoprotein-releasing ABC transporter permease subunit, partial [Caulobacteraceae bacterium]|nr:lipoprotein-releasing ABC transporter permease subunit [Caulobacteraceae bacterium]
MADPSALVPAGPFSAWERAIAFRYLRARRKQGGVALVSMISFFGVMAAVAVLIIVMSVMNGFRSELLGRMLGFNGHLYVGGPLLNDPSRVDQALARIRQVKGVTQAIPMVEAEALATAGGETTGVIVRGVRPADLKTMSLVTANIKPGSMQDFGEGDYGGDLILMGSRLAAQLDVRPGDPVTLTSPCGSATAFGCNPTYKPYTIDGLFTVGMSEYDQTYIYMPLAQAQALFGRDQAIDVIEIKVTDPDRAVALRPLIQQAAGPEAIVTTWEDKNESFFNALEVERDTMRLILLLIVLVAALNIISGLWMLVKNKGRDIAILRSMGASQGAILRIFFMSGAAIGVLGTLAGFLVGALFCIYIKQIQAFVQWVTGTNVFSADVYFLSH